MKRPAANGSFLRIEIGNELIDQIAERASELVAERRTPAEPLPYLTVKDAADYMRCKPRRVYDLCSQRRLPFAKDGSRTLLRRADLDTYLENST